MSTSRGEPTGSSAPTDDQDRNDRDELDRRLRRSEADRTRQLASKRDSSKQLMDLAKRLKLDPTRDRDKLMEEMRQRSRMGYLNQRAPKQLEILKADLAEEKQLFSDLQLTERERKRMEYDAKILQTAESALAASKKGVKSYLMPDSQPLLDGAVEEDEELDHKGGDHRSEQRNWERLKLAEAGVVLPTDIKGDKSTTTATTTTEALVADFKLLLEDEEFCRRVARGDTFEGELVDVRQLERENREKSRKQMLDQRQSLPVYARKGELLEAIKANQIVIVQGETGCGKTTQIPQYLHEAGYTRTEMKHGEVKMVGCTQPRRVAAMSVAARVSQEMGTKLGHAVGYSIRFEDCTSEGTVIKYMTDGMLLREILDDPTLSKYAVMIVDEAHERTLHTDILLTLLKDVTRARDDFRLIISSATLDEQKFLTFFERPPVFKIKGRLFEVKHIHMKADQKVATTNIAENCLRAVMQIHTVTPPGSGDILVFLAGQEEIEELQEELERCVRERGAQMGELLIRPIFANLPTDLQAKVFERTPAGARKVVLATNIAETSITIDGIVYVVDTGYCKQNQFSSKTGMETLAVTRISRASANQRAGRAGRNRPGKCYRLYTSDEFNTEFEENTQPEIQRLNLANVVLLLKTMKINDVLNFEYVDRPPTEMLLFAIEQLTALGALDRAGELTLMGRRMAEFPLEPKMSKALLVAEEYGCTEEVLTIMSMLSVNGSIFFKPKDKKELAEASRKSFFSLTGDHLMLLKVYNDWAMNSYDKKWCLDSFVQYKSMCRARDIRDQLESLCEKVEVKLLSSSADTSSKILKAILGGFFYNVARLAREGGSYRTIKKNQTVHIHPSSALHKSLPRWVVFNELRLTTQEYMRNVSEIEPSWLVEVAPSFYDRDEVEEMSKRSKPKINRGKSRADLNPTYGGRRG